MTTTESLPHLHERAAQALADWQAKHAVVCEHSQIIDYGAAVDTVLKAVADEVGDYAAGLMDASIKQVLGDDEGGFNATLRAATAAHVADLLRNAVKGGA